MRKNSTVICFGSGRHVPSITSSAFKYHPWGRRKWRRWLYDVSLTAWKHPSLLEAGENIVKILSFIFQKISKSSLVWVFKLSVVTSNNLHTLFLLQPPLTLSRENKNGTSLSRGNSSPSYRQDKRGFSRELKRLGRSVLLSVAELSVEVCSHAEGQRVAHQPHRTPHRHRRCSCTPLSAPRSPGGRWEVTRVLAGGLHPQQPWAAARLGAEGPCGSVQAGSHGCIFPGMYLHLLLGVFFST